jgi:Tol biopolymer transport system component
LFTQVNRSTRNDVWVLRVNEKEPPVPVLHSRFNEEEARFSPDAKWIAYVSDETGRREVYVQTFPTSDQRYQISSSGGTNPKWRQDGRELFYKSGDGKVVTVSVSTAPAFEHRRSPVTITLPPDAAFYDVAPDGQRVLVLGSASGSQVGSPFTVVLNWTAALKK